METAIAVVTEISGEVYARAADGSLRSLQPGDQLFAGETLVTAESGQVVLDFGNGEVAEFGPNQALGMTEQILGSTEPVPFDNQITDPSVAAVLAALDGEGDLLDDLEAPAAGTDGAPEGGGSSIVQLVRVFESVDPLAFSFDQEPVEPFEAPIGEQDGELLADDLPETPEVPEGPDVPTFTASVAQPFLFSGPLKMITAVGDTAYSVVGDLEALFSAGTTYSADGRLVDKEIFPGSVVSVPDAVQGLSASDIEASIGLDDGALTQFMQSDAVVADILGAGVQVEVHDGKLMTSLATLQEGAVVKFDFTFFNGEVRVADLQQGKVDAVILVVSGPDGTQIEHMLSSADLVNGQSIDVTRTSEFIFTASSSGEYQFHWLVVNGSDTQHDSALSVSQPSFAPDATSTDFYNHPVGIDLLIDPASVSNADQIELIVGGVPSGSVLNYGTEIADGVWLIDLQSAGVDFSGLQLYTPLGYTGDVELSLTVQSTLNSITESSEQSLQFNIDITENAVQEGTQDTDSVLEGSSGNDVIHGYQGDDILIGGQGNDILFGGLGADTFVWRLDDDGDVNQPAVDIVADFDRTQGDVLHLAELLDFNDGLDSIHDFLELQQQGEDMVLNVSPQGNGEVTQSIVLKGVFGDFDTLGSSVQEVVDSLIESGHIVVE